MTSNIRKIKQIYKSLGKIERFDWLNGRNFSDAFVISIGAGPWRRERRAKIQQEALNFLRSRDLFDVEICDGMDFVPEHIIIKCYPLDWQNKYLYNMIKYLQENNITMDEYCNNLIDGSPVSDKYDPHIREFLYQACGNPKGIKVLSLFCRDALDIPSFPIDRHVRRYLKEQNLPTNEREMVDLCFSANLDPNLVATGIVKNIGNVQNPNWAVERNKND